MCIIYWSIYIQLYHYIDIYMLIYIYILIYILIYIYWLIYIYTYLYRYMYIYIYMILYAWLMYKNYASIPDCHTLCTLHCILSEAVQYFDCDFSWFGPHILCSWKLAEKQPSTSEIVPWLTPDQKRQFFLWRQCRSQNGEMFHVLLKKGLEILNQVHYQNHICSCPART